MSRTKTYTEKRAARMAKAPHTLEHVTVNTAHSTPIPRDFIRQETYDLLAPLVTAGGGPVPNLPYTFVIVEQGNGVATVDFSYVCGEHVLQVAVGTICAKRSESDGWWDHLLHTAQRVGVTRGAARPASTPWLGVVLLPSPAWLAISPEESGLLGSLENWVAWTWLRLRETAAAAAWVA